MYEDTDKPESIIKGYALRTHDISVYEDETTIVCYYEHPIFFGTDPLVKEINKVIEEGYEVFANGYGKEYMDEEMNFFRDYEIGNEIFRCAPTSVTDIYYDDNFLSFGLYWDWFMGGVYNEGFDGLNISLKNGEDILLEDCLGLSHDDMCRLIAKKLSETYDIDENMLYEKVKTLTDIKFHFTPTCVYVGFESYALDLGTSAFEITITGDDLE